ncbi:MAG TPA: molybdopterin-dependent oxidoreductase [Dictyobacter sp.]|nr:molybdopterin-dependent oxidoreductase [Dictyobacter sp.]
MDTKTISTDLSISKKERWDLGFQAGLLAGIIASAVMILLSFTINGVSLPDILGAAIALAMPLQLFTYLHNTIGGDAKHYLFYVVLIGQCLIFALCGGLWNVLVEARSNKQLRWIGHGKTGTLSWLSGLILALVLWLLSGFLFLPATGSGIFGSSLTTGVPATILSLTLVGIVYGLAFVWLYNWLYQRAQISPLTEYERSQQRIQRRIFIRRGAIVIGIGALGYAAWRFITSTTGSVASTLSSQTQSNLLKNYQSKITPPPKPNYGTIQPVNNLSPEITSNQDFYKVSKNLVSDPTVNGQTWQLTINGEVDRAYTLNYSEITALPMKQQYETLMCISNEVGGSYMSNALWEGIPLVDLLNRTGGIKPGATKVVLYAADGYSDSIHLSKALDPTTLVALHMNGQTLPEDHGYPARLLVPGIYGMKHVKWINRIEVVNTDYQGYWQQNGWSDSAEVRMTSRIDTPQTNTTIAANKPTYIAGVAFSGNKGISQVDVSIDGGQTWKAATLKRPLSAFTWVIWELPWQPQQGQTTIIVRAIDMEGNVQNPQPAPPLPNGASGYDSVAVTVQ